MASEYHISSLAPAKAGLRSTIAHAVGRVSDS